MARHLIQSAATGDTRIVGDAALPFFPGYLIKDTLDDGEPEAVYYGAGESDLRYVNVTELSDPASAASVALKAAFPSRTDIARVKVPRRGLAVIGDSIASYNSSNSHVWHKLMCLLTGQRIRHTGFFATGGFTLAQIEATHLPQVLAMNPLPGACVVAGGTNDTGAVTPDIAASKATHTRIVDALLAAGIMPVLWTLPPRDDSTTVNGLVGQWNAWVRERAALLGLPLVDSHAALVDPATGLFQPALKQDNIHPNDAGHLAIARRMVADSEFIARFADGRVRLTGAAADGANLIPNGEGLFLNDANADGRGDGWNSFGSGITYSRVVDAAAVGQWQRLTIPVGAGGGMQRDIAVTAGRTIALAARLRADMDTATPAAQIGLSGSWRDGSGAVAGNGITAASNLRLLTTADSVVAYGTAVAPAGATLLRVSLAPAGTATKTVVFDIAQVTVDDLTALGIA